MSISLETALGSGPQVWPEKQAARDQGLEKKSGTTGEQMASAQASSVGEAEMLKAIERANKAVLGPTTSFRYSVHEGTKEIVVRVVNSETGETIREIPPQKILDLVAKLWELSGVFVDERR